MDHLIDDDALPRNERELTLSTGAILGIFFGLVLLCGAFFGFGYNMGRKSAPTPLNLSDSADAVIPPAVSGAGKPAAGSPVDDTAVATTAPVPATPKPARHTPPPQPAADETTETAVERPKPAVTRPAQPAAAPIVRQPVPAPTMPAITPGGSFIVQVAAVSHQEDAALLVGALRARGYTVAARSAAGDNFIHVQVGPFRDKKDADAMRQRLQADGYNAIIK